MHVLAARMVQRGAALTQHFEFRCLKNMIWDHMIWSIRSHFGSIYTDFLQPHFLHSPFCWIMHHASLLDSYAILLGTRWCFIIHHDKPSCVVMHHGAPWCIMMHHDASWYITIYTDASWCTMIPLYILMHYAGAWSSWAAPQWAWCIMMHHSA